jgi:hypothetical protein
MSLEKHFKLAGIEVAEHESIDFNHWHEGLPAQFNRSLFRSRIAARVADFVFPPSFVKPRFGFLTPTADRPAVKDDVLWLLEDVHDGIQMM